MVPNQELVFLLRLATCYLSFFPASEFTALLSMQLIFSFSPWIGQVGWSFGHHNVLYQPFDIQRTYAAGLVL